MAVINVSAEAGASTKTYVKADGHNIFMDEPPLFGGEDSAPSPVSLFLASIAGCINATGQRIAREMNFVLKHMDVLVNGKIDSDAFFGGDTAKRAGFNDINVKIELDADIEQETKDLWLEQVIARCPVIDNIMNTSNMSFSVIREN